MPNTGIVGLTESIVENDFEDGRIEIVIELG
jgi:hypothetical protein